MVSTTCLNCNSLLQPEQQFCSRCGQSAKTHRIGFAHLMHELLHGFTHADKGIFYTIKMLAVKPGLVAREYLEGKRKKYFPPVNFYLILIGLFVFAFGFFLRFQQSNTFAQVRTELRNLPDSLAQMRDRRLAKLDRAETVMSFMTKRSNLVNLLLATPLSSFVFFLFYRRHKYNFIEHFTVNLYFSGFGSLIFIFIIAPLVSFVDNQAFYLAALSFFLLTEMVYRSIAYYQFVGKKGSRHYLFSLLASFTSIALWIVLSRVAVNYYIEHGLPHFF
jgi:hypothetical protein